MKPYTVARFLLIAWPFSYMYTNGGRSKMSTRHVSGTYNHENDLFIWLYWFLHCFIHLSKNLACVSVWEIKFKLKKTYIVFVCNFYNFCSVSTYKFLTFELEEKYYQWEKIVKLCHWNSWYLVVIFISIKIIQDYVFNRITLWGKEILHLP